MMQRDFTEFIELSNQNKMDYVIIGGIALAFYGYPRYTGDLDIWIYPSAGNIRTCFIVIEKFFGTPVTISPEEFIDGRKMITLGEEPVQIQIHLHLDGVTSEEIWGNKAKGKFGSVDVYYIGKETFIRNKRSAGRPQDLIDIEKILD